VPPPDFTERTEFPRAERRIETEPTAEEAYRAGLTEGEQRGREAALKEVAPAIAELRRLAASLTHLREQRIADAEQDLVEVATEMARRILHGELRQDTDSVLRLARACVQEAGESEPLVLHVAVEDVDLVRTHLPDLASELAEAELRIEPDATIPRGSVVLEAGSRCYEGRPERILAQARAQLATEGTP
jgi:flagellar assembly protein FliH